MANNTGKQILEEGPKNVVVKLTGVADTSNIVWAPAIQLSDFLNNDKVFGTFVGFRVMEVDYSSGPNMVTRLEWQSNSPQLICAVAQSEWLDLRKIGGAAPDRTISGYNGAINLVTQGFVPGTVEAFTVILKLAKLYSQTGL